MKTPFNKSFLRWAGSKRKLIPKLLPYWNPQKHKRYVEPFMGSAAFFFNIQPSSAFLSDFNSELVETFIAVRDHPRAVFNRYKRFPIGKEKYYEIRETDPRTLSKLDQAARFIYLNRYCFNGIYRTNANGQFNVPYASSRTGLLPDFEHIRNCSNTLRGAEIICADFEHVLNTYLKQGDFVYLDPPYAVENRRIFRQYGPHTFGLNDLDRLGNALAKLDSRGIDFVVSYALSKESLNTFSEWHIQRTFTQRNVSGFAKHRRKAVELLVSNIE